jgi:predicted ester cyclase
VLPLHQGNAQGRQRVDRFLVAEAQVADRDYSGFPNHYSVVPDAASRVPRLQGTTEYLFAEGDKVALGFTSRDAHEDELMGVAPPASR